MSISSPPNYGSPDWQRGAYSPQKEVLTARLSGGHVVFDVPPNAESLIAFISASTLSSPPILTGVATGLAYVGRKVADGSSNQSGVWLYDAAPSLDSQMQIGGGSPIDPITVTIYADAGVHVVADVSKVINLLGQQYVIPSVPSTVAGDHPLNELQHTSGTFSANGTLLGAPGVGLRYRIFDAMIGTQGTASVGYLQNNTLGQFCIGGPSAPGSASFYPSGLVTGANTSIDYAQWSGTGNMLAMVTYTIETI